MSKQAEKWWTFSALFCRRDRNEGPARLLLLFLQAVTAMILLAGAAPAAAHNAAASTGAQMHGIEIPAIDHGEMALLAPYRAAIISLAERQTETDETLRRLLNYAKLQFTYCLWGLVPGAVRDEESMFNACSHAYLAGASALLNDLEIRPQARAQALAIKASIEKDKTAAPWLVLCAYSKQRFYTGHIVSPDWSALMPQYGLPAAILVLLVTGGGVAVFRKGRWSKPT